MSTSRASRNAVSVQHAMTSAEAMIDMHGVVKRFKNAAGEFTVLKGVDLTINRANLFPSYAEVFNEFQKQRASSRIMLRLVRPRSNRCMTGTAAAASDVTVRAPGEELAALEVQKLPRVSAGIATGTREPDAARALIKFFTSPAAAPAITRSGLEHMTSP